MAFDGDEPVFRDEVSFLPWDDYAVERWGVAAPEPLYSPWQLLPLHDVLRGASAELPVEVLLDSARRNDWITRLAPLLDGQLRVWRSLNERWTPTLKLLVALQNRFWPSVFGRFVVPWDAARREERFDIMEEEVTRFDPLALLDTHDITPEELTAIYQWLVERGAQIEGGYGPFTSGGDRWGRLRQVADRRERTLMQGPARAALDFYEAAEMIGRCWWEMTGRSLPGIDVVPYRRTTIRLDHETVTEPSYERSRNALRAQLLQHGLWPGRIHVVVEGQTEEEWLRELMIAFFGEMPEGLQISNIHGSGNAHRIEPILRMIADYASYNALIVDAEGEMARYVDALISADLVNSDDVLMVDSSFEEANFTDDELVRVVKDLAAHPPGDRQKVAVRLTARKLRTEQMRRVKAAKPGQEPGLARTLLEMLREDDYGPVNLKKIELAAGLVTYAVNEIERTGIDDAVAHRPIIRFITERIANPLANDSWH